MQAVPVNYMAVLACGVASMVLGFLWYGPVFGKTWIELMGSHAPRMDSEEGKKKAQQGYIISFIGALVMAYVLSHVLVFASAYTKTMGLQAGLMVGFWNWLGFVAPVTLGGVLWEGKSWKLWCFNNAYYLVQLLMFGAILVSWK